MNDNVDSVVRHSCGDCRHFEDIGMKNWGNCLAPLPRWAQETVDHSGSVWRDGGNQDYAHECETFVPNNTITVQSIANLKLPLRVGGVMRCCIKTLEDAKLKENEGDECQCLFCHAVLHVRNAQWELKHA